MDESDGDPMDEGAAGRFSCGHPDCNRRFRTMVESVEHQFSDHLIVSKQAAALTSIVRNHSGGADQTVAIVAAGASEIFQGPVKKGKNGKVTNALPPFI